MPISGVVIRCRPEKALEVSETVALDGAVEVHGVLTDGQIVAVIEADSVDGEVGIVSDLMRVDGVIDVRLAYHDFSDLCPENSQAQVP
ncbi:MAG TPA: chaperone NapD [Geobacteraceae bacterium]